MKITGILAIDKKHGVSKDNKIPWLGNPLFKWDMEFFKGTTTNHAVIMGRKTMETLKGPLPNRTNIVISSNSNLDIPPVSEMTIGDDSKFFKASSIENALEYLKNEEEVFIIGGASIYQKAYEDNICTRWLISHILWDFETDLKIDFYEKLIKKSQRIRFLALHDKGSIVEYMV